MQIDYDKLRKSCFPTVLRWVVLTLHVSRDEAKEITDDIMQEALISFSRKVDTYDSKRSKITTFYLAFCKRTFLNAMRTQRTRNKHFRRNEENIDFGIDALDQDLEADIFGEVNSFKKNKLLSFLADCKNLLKGVHKELVELYYEQGLSRKEVAQKLGFSSEQVISVTGARCIETLKKCLLSKGITSVSFFD